MQPRDKGKEILWKIAADEDMAKYKPEIRTNIEFTVGNLRIRIASLSFLNKSAITELIVEEEGKGFRGEVELYDDKSREKFLEGLLSQIWKDSEGKIKPLRELFGILALAYRRPYSKG
jgi:hypothetical protein